MKSFYIKLLAAVLFLMSFSCMPVFGEVYPRVIKVGCYDLQRFITKSDSGGGYSGYGVDFLKELSKYTGWSYEFVYGTKQQNFEKLADGEIDILFSIDEDVDSENFISTDIACGYRTDVLCTSAESPLYYNDYSSFEGLTVGLVRDDKMERRFLKFAETNKFSVNLKYYPTYNEMNIAVKNGQIDAALIDNNRRRDSYKIIAVTSVSPYFIMTSNKNEDICRAAQEGIERMYVDNPYYRDDLYRKYYENDVYSTIEYTKEEKEFIDNHPVLKVAVRPDWGCIERYNSKQQKAQGVNIGFLELISEETGIDFEYIYAADYFEAMDLVSRGSADILSSEICEYSFANDKNIFLTNPYTKLPIVMVEKEAAFDKDSSLKIGLVLKNTTAVNYINEYYPKAEVLFYNDVDKCIQAVKSGNADAFIAPLFIVQSIPEIDNDSGYKTINLENFSYNISAGVNASYNPVLTSIINKAISRITEEERTAVILQNISEYEKLSFDVIWYNYRVPIIISFFMFILVGTLTAYLFRKKQVSFLSRIAYVDNVTGDINYNRFLLEGEKLISSINKQYLIGYMDISGFKYINDIYGRDVGDDVLKYVFNLLKDSMGSQGICTRVNADTFIFIKVFDGVINIENIKAEEEFINYYPIADSDYIKIKVNCGIYVPDESERDLAGMCDKAMLACKLAKNSIQKHIEVYDENIDKKIMRENEISANMEFALLNGEFKVYLQPKYSLETGEPIGAEALIRWFSEKMGFMPPNDFIPLFEKNGFIVNLDFYVLEQVCILIRSWLDSGIKPVIISVNQSRNHLTNPNYLEKLRRMINSYDIPPNLIELELTESALFNNTEYIVEIMQKVKSMGFLISIDDFGSGYSSLDLLRKMPLDVLKIDKSFLDSVEVSERSKIMLEQVVTMAKRIKVKTICEGVETETQEELLKSMGCDFVQGYLYAKPMPVDDFNEIIVRANA